MPSVRLPGTEGYAEEAAQLLNRYESLSFADVHGPALHLIPNAPCRVLDIGSGTGRDAADFAAMGHRVVAVEPTDEFRTAAAVLHPSPLIAWINDSLPDLRLVLARGGTFDLVMLTAVWMHLDAQQRQQAMPNVASLLRDGGRLIMALRHGPVPRGRRMFEVDAEETIALAHAQGLSQVLHLHTPSIQDRNRRQGVTWTRLAFAKGSRAD